MFVARQWSHGHRQRDGGAHNNVGDITSGAGFRLVSCRNLTIFYYETWESFFDDSPAIPFLHVSLRPGCSLNRIAVLVFEGPGQKEVMHALI